MKKNIELLILLLVLNLTLIQETIARPNNELENDDEVNACIIICSECFINDLNISIKKVYNTYRFGHLSYALYGCSFF